MFLSFDHTGVLFYTGESPHQYPGTLEVDRECTIPNVVNEIALSGVHNWQLLGAFLGLSQIDLVFPPDSGLMEKYQLLVEAWFRRDPHHSWSTIRLVLERMQEINRRESYSASSVSSVTSTPMSPRAGIYCCTYTYTGKCLLSYYRLLFHCRY